MSCAVFDHFKDLRMTDKTSPYTEGMGSDNVEIRPDVSLDPRMANSANGKAPMDTREDSSTNDSTEQRVYAMSDFHGDYQVLMDCLLMTGAIYWNEAEHDYTWIAGRNVQVVIIGDLVDGARADHGNASISPEMPYKSETVGSAAEKIMLFTIGYLQRKSEKAMCPNGLVFCLGNHEVANLFPFDLYHIQKYEKEDWYIDALIKHYVINSTYVHHDEMEHILRSDVHTIIGSGRSRDDLLRFLKVVRKKIETMDPSPKLDHQIGHELQKINIQSTRKDQMEKMFNSRFYRYLLRLHSYNNVEPKERTFCEKIAKPFGDIKNLEKELNENIMYGTLLLDFCKPKLFHIWNDDKVWFVHGGLTGESRIAIKDEKENNTILQRLMIAKKAPIYFVSTHYNVWREFYEAKILTDRNMGYLLNTTNDACEPLANLKFLKNVEQVIVGHCNQTCAFYKKIFKKTAICQGEASWVAGKLSLTAPRAINHHLRVRQNDAKIAFKQEFVIKDDAKDCGALLTEHCKKESRHIGINGTRCADNKFVWRVDCGSSTAFCAYGDHTKQTSERRTSILEISFDTTKKEYNHVAWVLPHVSARPSILFDIPPQPPPSGPPSAPKKRKL